MERTSSDNMCTMHPTGKTIPCINLASYNYLGFADDWQVNGNC
jgi:7-keto-8-aminopelargonate synthetase-like enzyme